MFEFAAPRVIDSGKCLASGRHSHLKLMSGMLKLVFSAVWDETSH